jgi:hypothetical protein
VKGVQLSIEESTVHEVDPRDALQVALARQ